MGQLIKEGKVSGLGGALLVPLLGMICTQVALFAVLLAATCARAAAPV